MAQTPTTGPGTRLSVSRGSTAPAVSDPLAPILLEFESPSAALLAEPVPMRSRYTTWILCSMFAATLAVCWTVPIDRVVSATGKVTTTAPTVVVQPLETSIVKSINVREGQLVHKGDLLAQLDPTIPASDERNSAAQMASLTAEVQRIQDELDGKTYLSDGTPAGNLQEMLFTQRHAAVEYKVAEYDRQIESLQAKADSAKSDIEGYTARLSVATTVEEKRRELERLQVGAQLDTLAATDNRDEMTRDLHAAQSALSGALQDLKATQSDRDNWLQQWRADTSQNLHDEGIKLDQARDDDAKAKLRTGLVMERAPTDAIVLQIAKLSPGSVMQSGDQFITLVPINSPMEIDGIIPGEEAGFVSVGDSVTIKFDSFPYTTYGTARGVVQSVSPDSFHDPASVTAQTMSPGSSSQTRTDQAMGAQFFNTVVSIEEVRMHGLPPNFRVSPGMPVHADIKVGAHTVIEYLMSRVIPPVTEGMREP